MVEGRRKSRSVRRMKKTTPSGKHIVQYYNKKSSKAQCAGCGMYLHGVPNVSTTKLRNMSKSKRRPERPYGGCLCSKCSRAYIIIKVRNVVSSATGSTREDR